MSIEASQRKTRAMAEAYGSISETLAERPELAALRTLVEERRSELNENKFSLMVLGEFKRGKSTLINALLGDDLLPSKVTPCTAIITFVRYGPESTFEVRFKDPDKPPHVLSADEFKEQYELRLDDIAGVDAGDTAAVAGLVKDRFDHIDHAVLRFPAALCRNGVEIIDTPGLEEDPARTQRVLENMRKADAVILVVDASQQLNQREQHFFENYLARLKLDRRLFVAVNGWNLLRARVLRRDDEREVERAAGDVWEVIRRKVFPLVSAGGQDPNLRVFRIDALGALRHRLGLPDAPTLDSTGVPQLERSLNEFLAGQRDAARDESDRTLLDDVTGRTHVLLDSQLKAAARPLEDARAEMRHVEARLANLDSKSKSIREFIQSSAHQIADEVSRSLDEYMDREIGENADQISRAVDVDSVTRIASIYGSIFDFFKKDENKFSAQVSVHIRRELERLIAPKLVDWSEGTLVSLLKNTAAHTIERLEELMAEYVQQRNELQGGASRQVRGIPADDIKRQIERLLHNLHAGDVVAASVDLTPIIAGIAGEVLLHKLAAGVTLGASLIVTAAIALFRQKGLQANLRHAIRDGLVKNLPSMKAMMKEAVRDRIVKEMNDGADRLKKQLDREVELIKASRQAVIERLEAGGFEFAKFRTEIDDFSRRFDKAAESVAAVLQRPAATFVAR